MMKYTKKHELWMEQKVELKKQFADLTDQDLSYEPGRCDDMFDRVRVKLGKSKEELANIILTL
jgi:hypothetical protein